jgi:hypothetical protein
VGSSGLGNLDSVSRKLVIIPLKLSPKVLVMNRTKSKTFGGNESGRMIVVFNPTNEHIRLRSLWLRPWMTRVRNIFTLLLKSCG